MFAEAPVLPELYFLEDKVIEGDVLDVLETLPKDKFYDLIIADPPYNIGKDFGEMKGNMSLGDYIGWSKNWMQKAFSFLKDDGIMYIYGFSEILAHISVCHPIEKQRWLIWHYTNKTVPRLNFWQRSHESILCLWKHKKPILQVDNIREPYTETFLNNSNGKIRKNTCSRYGGKNGKPTYYKANGSGALPRDVIKVPALAGGSGSIERWFKCYTCGGHIYPPQDLNKHRNCDIWKHPTQKPMKLTEKLIKSVILEKGNVLIPFAGSGSECVVAKKMGVNFTAIELNPEYVDFINKWLNYVQINTKNVATLQKRFN